MTSPIDLARRIDDREGLVGGDDLGGEARDLGAGLDRAAMLGRARLGRIRLRADITLARCTSRVNSAT